MGPRSPRLLTVALAASELAVTACGTRDPGFASPYGAGGLEDPGSGGSAGAGVVVRAEPDGGGPDPDAAVLLGAGEGGAATGASREAGPAGPLATFVLVNASVTTVPDGQTLPGFDPIPEDARIDLATVGARLSIVALTHPAVVGSVLFSLDGTYTHVEETPPYSLCGDDGAGTFGACSLAVGAHTLVATDYAGADLDGGASTPTTLRFEIVDTSDGGPEGG